MNPRTVLTTAVAPALWGTTYVVTSELLPPGRPLLAAALRALPAGLILLAWTRTLPRGGWWWRSLALGALNFAAFFFLLFTAAYRLPGGVAATVGAIQPLLVLILAGVLLSERTSIGRYTAAVTGVAGVALLVLDGGASLDLLGVLAALGGAVSMAAGSVLVQRWGRPVRPLAFAGWQLTAGGVLLVPAALAFEGLPDTLTPGNVTGYAYLAVLGGALAYTLWFRGITMLGARNATFLALLSPLVATAIGALRGERFGPMQAFGAAIVFAAVAGSQLIDARRTSGRRPSAVPPGPGRPIGLVDHHERVVTSHVAQ